MQQTISIIITGKVQGVFYRQSAKEKAMQLGLTGQVNNLHDGSVQILVTGVPGLLKLFTEWCKGPPWAVVAGVEILELPLKQFEHFTIVRF
ncbi:MAG: acylphosphatase [Chitinophagaceae bacterium]|nr:acylphosphatase [Chitinophagaceae bacterium]